MKKIFIKISIGLAIAVFLFFSFVSFASAWDTVSLGSISGGAITGAVNTVLNYLGVDQTELKNNIATMNTSRQKKNPPQVSLNFNPANPIEGEKVTVTATPTYFMNSMENLYFTWFLKSDGCDETKSPSAKEKEKCDLDKDGEIDIEDYKIKAMRIIANDDFNWESANYNSSSDGNGDGYRAVFGGDDQRGKNDHCFVHDTSSGDEYEIECKHLFPKAPGESTGDNSFGRNEEKFWRTDPNAEDTAHTGNVDEANVAGLGINSFTWNFEAGDKVGVVVEGISVEPTQESDSSYKTMWAMPVEFCEVDVDVNTEYPKSNTEIISTTADTPIAGQTTIVSETTDEEITSRAAETAIVTKTVTETTTIIDSLTEVEISSVDVVADPTEEIINIGDDISVEDIADGGDLNECLYDNLVSPAENGPQSEKLKVSLSYSPLSPINDKNFYADPTLSSGDDLIVISSIPNANDSSYVKYQWEVFSADEANPDSWGGAIAKSNLPNASQMTGLGLDTFKFKLNLKNPQKYLKIKLTATESVGQKLSREGHSDVVIPINSTGSYISVFNADVSTDLDISMGNGEICKDGIDKALCPVAKNQIISLEVPKGNFSDFAWTIDGKPSVFQKEDKQNNEAYFAVLKEKGERYIVNLIATDTETGDKINLSRIFEVVDPQVIISSADEAACKPVLLGNYIDVDGKYWPDYSKLNFWGLSGYDLKLKAEASGFSILPSEITWSIDGNAVNASNAATYGFSIDEKGILTLLPKDAGESYSVSAGAIYTQSSAVKKALNKYWGVAYNQFYEKVIGDSITITMQDFSPTYAEGKNQKVFASVFSAMPSYLGFLLRITLTAFLIVFVSRLAMSFFPKIEEK